MCVAGQSQFRKHRSPRILPNQVWETPSIPVRRVRKDVLLDERHALLPSPTSRQKLFDDGRSFAGIYCAEQVEARARFGARWTDGFLEQKFPVAQWEKETADEKVVRYMGDKVEFQNRYGTWETHLYECLVDVKNEKILSVNVAPRS